MHGEVPNKKNTKMFTWETDYVFVISISIISPASNKRMLLTNPYGVHVLFCLSIVLLETSLLTETVQKDSNFITEFIEITPRPMP